MVSKTFADRQLRTALGDHDAQIAWQASSLFVRFLWDLADAVASEARKRFRVTNHALEEAQKKPRKRMWHGPVLQAVREVLENPDRHIPQWLDRQRPPRP